MDSLITASQSQELLQTAFKEHQQGNFQSALDKYLQILNTNPNQADALHLSGLIYMQANHNELAIKHIEKSTKLAPQNTDAWNNLGIAFFNSGKYKQAINAYKNCIKLNKNHFQAHNNIGNVYRNIKDYPNAIKAFNSALSLQPNYPDAENNLANTLKDIGKTKSAIKHYKKAIELNPDFIDALKNLGLALYEIGDHQQAIVNLERCISLNPNDADTIYLYSRSYFEIEQYDKALENIEKAIEANNCDFEYYNTKGTILTRQELWNEAIEAFSKAANLNHASESIYINLGSAHKGAQSFREAETAYLQALKINDKSYIALNDLGVVQRLLGKHSDAINNLEKSLSLLQKATTEKICPSRVHNNLGLVYVDLMLLDKAKSEFDKAIDIDNQYVDAIMGRAMLDLWNGNFESWWRGYEYRLQISKREQGFGILNELEEWDYKSSPPNTPIVILPEQGIGDEIMFAGIIPDLINSYNGNITLACDKRLVDIFQRSFPHIKVTRLNGLQVTTDQQKIHLASLAQYFRKKESDFPKIDQYIFPVEEKIKYFQKKYSTVSGLKIGISWKSGNTTEGKMRSIPLDQWEELLNSENCTFFNLQYGDTAKEIAKITPKIHNKITQDDEVNPIEDMENFIALASSLDLVITIDNSTAHITGALGIPTWVMLPFKPEWRWLKEIDHSIWYQSIKLFRQDKPNNWNSVLKTVLNELIHYNIPR